MFCTLSGQSDKNVVVLSSWTDKEQSLNRKNLVELFSSLKFSYLFIHLTSRVKIKFRLMNRVLNLFIFSKFTTTNKLSKKTQRL